MSTLNTNYPVYPYGYPYNTINNPYNYQNYQQTQPMQQTTPPLQTNSQGVQSVQRKFDVVQGKASAEIYNVNAGEEVFLLDMDNPNIYRKARGFDNILEPMEVYDVIPHKEEEKHEEIDLSAYVTSAEIKDMISDEIEKRIKDEVDKRLSEISFAPTTASVKPSRKRMTKKDEE